MKTQHMNFCRTIHQDTHECASEKLTLDTASILDGCTIPTNAFYDSSSTANLDDFTSAAAKPRGRSALLSPPPPPSPSSSKVSLSAVRHPKNVPKGCFGIQCVLENVDFSPNGGGKSSRRRRWQPAAHRRLAPAAAIGESEAPTPITHKQAMDEFGKCAFELMDNTMEVFNVGILVVDQKGADVYFMRNKITILDHGVESGGSTITIMAASNPSVDKLYPLTHEISENVITHVAPKLYSMIAYIIDVVPDDSTIRLNFNTITATLSVAPAFIVSGPTKIPLIGAFVSISENTLIHHNRELIGVTKDVLLASLSTNTPLGGGMTMCFNEVGGTAITTDTMIDQVTRRGSPPFPLTAAADCKRQDRIRVVKTINGATGSASQQVIAVGVLSLLAAVVFPGLML